METNIKNKLIIHSMIVGGVISGISGALLLILHLLWLTPFQLEGVEHPLFVLLQILSVCALQNTIVVFVVGLAGLGITTIWSKITKGNVLFLIRGTSIFLAFVPMVISWITFGAWNGQINSKVIIASVLALASLMAIAVIAARLLAKAPPRGKAVTFFGYIVATASLVLYIFPLFYPKALDTTFKTALDSKVTEVVSTHKNTENKAVKADKPKAVVLFTVDTLRADHLGCYGYQRNTSPNMDRLSREGVLFENMIASSSCTVPSCATLISGFAPPRHGAMDQEGVLSSSINTLMERFKNAGYTTLAVTANPLLSRYRGFAQGADKFKVLQRASSIKTMAQAKKMINDLNQEPFFLWVHLMDPHRAYKPPAEMYEDFLKDSLYSSRQLPTVSYGSYNGVKIQSTLTEEYARQKTVKEGEVVARYDGEIKMADKGLGILIELLKEKGILQDAVIFITADHGETLYRSKKDVYFQHCLNVYQSCVHVPAIAWGPSRIPQGKNVSRIVSQIDVFPTMLGLAGIPYEDADHPLPGTDLLNQQESGQENGRISITQSGYWDGLSLKMLSSDKRNNQFAIVTDKWKYIHVPHTDLVHVRGPRSFMHAWRSCVTPLWFEHKLYDLEKDPEEKNNLYGEKQEKAKELRDKLFKTLAVEMQAQEDINVERIKKDKKIMQQLRDLGYLD